MTDPSENFQLKGTIEALLLVSDKPVTLDQFKEVIEGIDGATMKETIQSLQKEYRDRHSGIVIVEIAGGYQMLTDSGHALAIRKFFKTRQKEKLSRPALETLAIIAYKQPVSRLDIEQIRGVNSDGVTDHLLAKGLIKIVGRKEVPGRPYLYGTTKQFLEYFGLKSLNDLPKLEDFTALQTNDSPTEISPLTQEEVAEQMQGSAHRVSENKEPENYPRPSQPVEAVSLEDESFSPGPLADSALPLPADQPPSETLEASTKKEQE